jgi:hypothetical protein
VIVLLFSISFSASTFLRHSVAVVFSCRLTIVFWLMVLRLSRAVKYFELKQHESKIVKEYT